VRGISARYRLSDQLDVQVLGSYLTESQGDSAERSLLGLAGRGIYKLAGGASARIGALGGLAVALESRELNGMSESASEIGVEGGLHGEYFATPWLSLHLEAGLLLSLVSDVGTLGEVREPLVPGDGAPPAADEGGYRVLLGVGDLFGAAGFTFWFD
jgi:hypothetical protein